MEFAVSILRTLIVLLFLQTVAWGEPLRLAFDHYPPFEYTTDGEIKGTSVELINEVCRRLGLTPEYIETPFARALYDAENGKIDGIFSLFRNTDRESFIYYVDEPVGETTTAIITKSGSGVTWQDLNSLYDYSIGHVRGYTHCNEVDSMPGLDITEVKDNIFLTKMLDNDRIQIAICNLDAIEHIHAKLGYKWHIETLQELKRRPLHIGFSRLLGKRGKMLAEEFNKELKNIKQENQKQN